MTSPGSPVTKPGNAAASVAPRGTPIAGAAALVTGGHRGFGRALVDEFLSRGAAKVYATSRELRTVDDKRVIPIVLDVTNEGSISAAAAAAQDVSIVVNNAGVFLGTDILEAPVKDIKAELETNLFGLIRVSRAFAPVLARNAPSSLVNVLSALSWLSVGKGYEVSKAAAWSATNALRLAMHDRGITVTALHVAYMDTDMTAGSDVPKADPRDIARLTAEAIVAGSYEILADDTTRSLKSRLSSDDITALYGQLS